MCTSETIFPGCRFRVVGLLGFNASATGSYQGGEMMKSAFWWRKPEYTEETTGLRQVTEETFHTYGLCPGVGVGVSYNAYGYVTMWSAEIFYSMATRQLLFGNDLC